MQSFSSDPQAIAEHYARFSDAANRHDWSTIADLFAEDALWETAAGTLGFRFQGRSAIHDGLVHNTSTLEVLHYQGAPPVVDLMAPDRARARTSISELLRVFATGEVKHLFGVYDDELTRRDGRWRFTHRSFTLRWETDERPRDGR